EQLEKKAAIDDLTGLGSQHYFQKAAAERLSSLRRHKGHGSFLRIDVDNFNQLFIQHGKQVADEVIKIIGECINQHVRKEDMAARVGLAKFALFLDHTHLNNAQKFAQRIIDEISNLKLTTKNFTVTASAGIFEPNIDKHSRFDEIYNRTENCLKQAIDKGGNNLVSENNSAQSESEPHHPLTIDQAITLLQQGESDEVKPHLENLFEQLAPLLKLFTQVLKK
ncbi:GGDEF domain-containing protein, partial [Beggiatoa alba]|nr:GGDEF domain-containing protein [Beggiatoa alba]